MMATLDVTTCKTQRLSTKKVKTTKAPATAEAFNCGPTWARTRDFLIMSQIL